ncbi:hypothetical protein [Aquimarina megaterium]|uniref:hypothetical protein n=1 Tax=Aquimarina megaterium TaxID=1443666 RepID=UPI001111AA9D|nr:hypothetical protein [Aquimarina megaterium]
MKFIVKINLIIKGILILLSMHCSWGNINSNSDCWLTDLNTKLENKHISSEFKSFIIKEKYSFDLYAILYDALPVEERTDDILTNIDNLKIIQKHIKHYPDKYSKTIVKEIKGEEGGWEKWKKVNFEDELYSDWDEILIKELVDEINHNKKLKDLFDAADRDKRVKLAYAWKLLYDFPELRLRSDVLESHIKVKRVWGPYKDVGKEPVLLSSLTLAYKVPVKGGKNNIEELKNIFLKDGYDLSEGVINVIELPDKTLLVISGHDHLMALEQLGQLVIPIEKAHFNKIDKSYYNQVYFFLEVSKKMGIYTGDFKVKLSPLDIHKVNDKIIEFITEKFDNSTIGPLHKVANIIGEEYMEAFKIDFLRENEFTEIILENYSLALSWKIIEMAGIDKAIGLDKKTLVFIDEFIKKNSGIAITPEDIAEQIKIAGGFDQWKKQQTRIKIINGKEYIVEEHGKNNTTTYKKSLPGTTYDQSLAYAVADADGVPDDPFIVFYLEQNTMIVDFKNVSQELRNYNVDEHVFAEAYDEFAESTVIEKIQFLWAQGKDLDYEIFKQALEEKITLKDALQTTVTGKWGPIQGRLILLKNIDENSIVLSFQNDIYQGDYYSQMLYGKYYRSMLDRDIKASGVLEQLMKGEPLFMIELWKIFAELNVSDAIRQGENKSYIYLAKYNLLGEKSLETVIKDIKDAGGWEEFVLQLKKKEKELEGIEEVIKIDDQTYYRNIIDETVVDRKELLDEIGWFIGYYLNQNYESPSINFRISEEFPVLEIDTYEMNKEVGDIGLKLVADAYDRLHTKYNISNILIYLDQVTPNDFIRNTNEYVRLVEEERKTIEEAAFSLPIGKQMQELGFTDVTIDANMYKSFLNGDMPQLEIVFEKSGDH